MVNKGDKYVIEVGEVLRAEKGELYKAKGFNSLIFDNAGLRKLKPLRAEWIGRSVGYPQEDWECSACGFKVLENEEVPQDYRFCPYCGTVMKEGF